MAEMLFIKVESSPDRATVCLAKDIGKFRPEGMRSLFATVNNFDLEYIFGLIFRFICKNNILPFYTLTKPYFYLF